MNRALAPTCAWKQSGATGLRTYYLYNQDGLPLAELDASGSVIVGNAWGPTGLMNRAPTPAYGNTRVQDWGGTCWFSFDERGNTTPVTDDNGLNGGVLSLRQYDAFGNSAQGVASVRPGYAAFSPFDGFGG